MKAFLLLIGLSLVGLFVSYIGNFDLEGEEKTATFCIYRNKPPFIRICTKNNRAVILFSEPAKTIDFYQQLKTVQTPIN